MSDGISQIVGSVSDGAQQVTGGLNAVNATLGAINEKIEGLHETKTEQLQVEVTALPDFVRDIYDKVAQITDGLTDSKDILSDIRDTGDEPLEVGEGPIYIGETLDRLLGDQSILVTSINDILQNLTGEQAVAGNATGPSLDFQDEGWQSLAQTIVAFVDTASAAGASDIQAGLTAIQNVSQFIDEAQAIFADFTVPGSVLELSTFIGQIEPLLSSIQEVADFAATIPDFEVPSFDNVSLLFQSLQTITTEASNISAISSEAIEGLGSIDTFVEAVQLIANELQDVAIPDIDVSGLFSGINEAAELAANMNSLISDANNTVTQLGGFVTAVNEISEQFIDYSDAGAASTMMASFITDLSTAITSISATGELAASSVDNLAAIADFVGGMNQLFGTLAIVEVSDAVAVSDEIRSFFTDIAGTFESLNAIQDLVTDASGTLQNISSFIVGVAELTGAADTLELDDFTESMVGIANSLTSLSTTLSALQEIDETQIEEAGSILTEVAGLFTTVSGLSLAAEEALSSVPALTDAASQIAAVSTSLTTMLSAVDMLNESEIDSGSLEQIASLITTFQSLSMVAAESLSTMSDLDDFATTATATLAPLLGVVDLLNDTTDIPANRIGELQQIIASLGELGEVATLSAAPLDDLSSFSEQAQAALGPLLNVLPIVNELSDIVQEVDLSQLNRIGDIFGRLSALGEDTTLTGNIENLADITSSVNTSMASVAEAFSAVQELSMFSEQVNMGGIAGMFEQLGELGDVASESMNSIGDVNAVATEIAQAFQSMGAITDSLEVVGELTEQSGVIIDGFKMMDDMMDVLGNLAGKSEMLGGVAGSLSNIEQFTALGDLFGQLALNQDALADSKSLTQDMMGAIQNLIVVGEFADELGDFKLNLEENLITPLSGLAEGAENLRNIASSVREINSELTKLSSDNADTLKSLNVEDSDSVFGSRGDSFGMEPQQQQNEQQGNDPQLAAILQELSAIKEVLSKEESSSWLEN